GAGAPDVRNAFAASDCLPNEPLARPKLGAGQDPAVPMKHFHNSFRGLPRGFSLLAPSFRLLVPGSWLLTPDPWFPPLHAHHGGRRRPLHAAQEQIDQAHEQLLVVPRTADDVGKAAQDVDPLIRFAKGPAAQLVGAESPLAAWPRQVERDLDALIDQ